jgi:peptidyl-prolyl cis-trans isomerase C
MTLKSGEVLQVPFEGPDGYHVIKLEDKRKVPFPALSEIKQVIRESLKKRKSETYLAGLIHSAKVENAKETKPKTGRAAPTKK